MSWDHNRDRVRILAAATVLEKRLQAIPSYGDDPRGWHRGVEDLSAELMARVTDRPTTCASDWRGGRFALMGFRATSTTGLVGAIQNWIAQVRKKAAA